MSPPPDPAVVSKDSNNESPRAESQSEFVEVVNAGPPPRTVWNRPSNGVLEAGSVMGGSVSWPALSESTRPVSRSSHYVSRSIGHGSTTASQAPASSHSSQGQPSTQSQPNYSPNHNRQRPRNRNGAAGGSIGSNYLAHGPYHNNLNQPLPPVPPPFPTILRPYQYAQPALDTSVTRTRPVRGVGGFQSHNGNNHSSNRSASRGANFGPRPHGEGQFHNNEAYMDGRDLRVFPPYMVPPMGFLPPPIPATPGHFVPSPPPMAIYQQTGFDIYPPEPFGAIPMMPPPPYPIPFPPYIENPLSRMIAYQIDYYFSDDNLIRDYYLRSKMDDNGWVPVSVIAKFHRIENMTKDIATILESLRYSNFVEVEGEKMRRRNEWSRWIISPPAQNTNNNASSSEDALAVLLHETSLNPSEDSSAAACLAEGSGSGNAADA